MEELVIKLTELQHSCTELFKKFVPHPELHPDPKVPEHHVVDMRPHEDGKEIDTQPIAPSIHTDGTESTPKI